MTILESIKLYFEKNNEFQFKEYLSSKSDEETILFRYLPLLVPHINDTKILNNIIDYVNKNAIALKKYKDSFGDDSFENFKPRLVFILIEKLTKSRENKSTILIEKSIELLKNEEFIEYFINFLTNEDVGEIPVKLFELVDKEKFISFLLNYETENINFIKNVVNLIQKTSENNIKTYEKFINDFVVDNNHQYRITGLQLAYQLLDDTKNSDLVDLIASRIFDINHFVRAKAISLLTNFVENENLIKLSIVDSLARRISDKASNVRKKSIIFIISVLVRYEKFQKNKKYNQEINLKDIFSNINHIIISILDHVKTEIIEILEYAKLSYYYEIHGADELLKLLIKHIMVHNIKFQIETLLLTLRDLIKKLRKSKIRYLNLLEDIKNTGITRKYRIVDTLIIKSIYNEFIYRINTQNKNLYERNNLKESFRLSEILSSLRMDIKDINRNIFIETINNFLLKSPTEESLSWNLKIYKNMLIFMINNRVKIDKRIIKILFKTKFIDFIHIEYVIKLIYNTDIDYVYYLVRILRNKYKLLYSLGSIAVNHSIYLDKLRNNKNLGKILVPEDIKERRKSYNSARMSITLQDARENEIDVEFMKNDLDNLKENPQNILVEQKSYELNENQKISENLDKIKEDEIEDVIFYIKEREMLYDKKSLLSQYVPLVLDGLKSDDRLLKEISKITLLKFMSLSSEFFMEHIDKLDYDGNSILALGDYMFLYNPIAEKYSDRFLKYDYSLFYYLGTNKILKIKADHMVEIIKESYATEIKNISKNDINTKYLKNGRFFIRKLLSSLDENHISFIFYECLLKLKESEILEYLVDIFKPVLKEKNKQKVYSMVAKIDDDTGNFILENLIKN